MLQEYPLNNNLSDVQISSFHFNPFLVYATLLINDQNNLYNNLTRVSRDSLTESVPPILLLLCTNARWIPMLIDQTTS